MAALTAVELLWWATAWSLGAAPLPFVAVYLPFAVVGLAAALALMLAFRPRARLAPWPALIAGTLLVGLGASLFLPLKYAIPSEVPFWLDLPLADAERSLFGADPWLPLDRLLGPALVPVDCVYALWLPTQVLGLFLVMVQPPSSAKSRALIAHSLAWFVLGVIAAVIFSSAGPIFFDRLFGGDRFALLTRTLAQGGAWVVLAESDAMWNAFLSGKPGLVAGISAFPSLHVAVSLWLVLAARALAPRAAPVAGAYFLFIWVASVQLGWHYIADGLGGAVGMIALWLLAAPLERALAERMAARSVEFSPLPFAEPR
jgi:hypothetical protein